LSRNRASITFDLPWHKVTIGTESESLEFGFEIFNPFHHRPFYSNGSVDGTINRPTFGHALKAAPPRIGQLAVKFDF